MFKNSVDASKQYSLMLQRKIDTSKKNRTDYLKKYIKNTVDILKLFWLFKTILNI